MASSSPHSAPPLPQLDPLIVGAMDDQSAALVMQLQLEDIANIFAKTQGNRRADDSDATDNQAYALRLAQQDLEATMTVLKDRMMSLKIAHETETEAISARAHRLAHRMDGDPDATAAAAPTPAPRVGGGGGGGEEVMQGGGDGEMPNRADAERDNILAQLASGRFFDDDDDDSNSNGKPKAESSSHAAKRECTITIDRRCEACRDDKKFFDVATMPHCRHDYCRECVDQLFRLSMTDETMFPPQCCQQPISLDDVRMILPVDTAREFQRKKPELETPNKTYCHRQACSTWIPPRNISDDVGTCPKCYLQTCTICKGTTHDGDCPRDEATQLLLLEADNNRWQRCYKCRSVVELNTGCHHIT
ncbi:hypothetical protein SLS58_009437 [Diplodia intermedia]|uniref:RBR-type E3 ubiquitin transferase n=1 Tax=Diplodia intermedia TaxID=856260 RepID=A0ABR3TCD4_9PEZI